MPVNWDDLKYLGAVARQRTMTAAARELHTNVATVSRRLERLKAEIGVPLLKKTADGWQLTDDAAPYVALEHDIRDRLSILRNPTGQPDDALSGTVRIGCYQTINQLTLTPRLHVFHQRFPSINLEINETNNQKSLARGEVDMVLRLDLPKGGRLVSRRVGTRVARFYIREGAELGKKWICLTEEFDQLPMARMGAAFFDSQPSIRTQSLQAIQVAIKTSGLPGPLMTCMARKDGDLVPVDDDRLVSIEPVHLVYHESRKGDPVLMAVAAWIAGSFPGPQKCLCGDCEL